MAVPGCRGKILRVDLTHRRLSEELLDDGTLRSYIGGASLAAKYLYGEVPPAIDWSHPENRLIFAAGPLNGARMAGAGSIAVVAKGTLTGGGACSEANGYFGAYLKFSGFDAVVVQGQAPDWVYLYVHDGMAELRDARNLAGKDTWETETLVKEELGKRERELSVYSIGLAGENLVRFAAIVGDQGHVAGHNGLGTVMASKRLKAVAAARGQGFIEVADPQALSKVNKETLEKIMADPFFGTQGHFQWGTSHLYSRYEPQGILAVKNLTTQGFPEHHKFTGAYYRPRWKIKPNPCWACRFHHCNLVEITEGPYAGYKGEEAEFEVMMAFGSQIGQTDPAAATVLGNETDRLGLEANETGWLMGMVIECYEAGVITREDTDGLEMTWGNAEAVRAMLYKIARRDGFGNTLAEGVKRAAEAIGPEAWNRGVFVLKGQSPRSHDHRARWSAMFDEATSNTGGQETGGITKGEELGLPPLKDPFSPEQTSTLEAKMKGAQLFRDSLVVCHFATGYFMPNVVAALKAVTGWGDFTLPEALRVGERAANLLRAFNCRQGITPDLEYPSPRYWSAPTSGPVQGKSIKPHWDGMLDNYYQLMGWDKKTGRPLPQTLEALGLGHVAVDLWGKEGQDSHYRGR